MLAMNRTAHDIPAVLVVEDEPLIRSLLAEELRDAGLVVVEASNATEALAYINAHGPPALLFSDVRMPGEIDGLALARRVIDNFPSTGVVITSANLGDRQVPPGAHFILKPYSLAKALSLTLALINCN